MWRFRVTAEGGVWLERVFPGDVNVLLRCDWVRAQTTERKLQAFRYAMGEQGEAAVVGIEWHIRTRSPLATNKSIMCSTDAWHRPDTESYCCKEAGRVAFGCSIPAAELIHQVCIFGFHDGHSADDTHIAASCCVLRGSVLMRA